MRVLVALLALAVVGCTADTQPEASPPEATAVTESARPTLTVQTLPPDLTGLPRLRTALPRRIPTDLSALPSLLDDPPGRASLVYHPAERRTDPVDGWASETLLFYGVDGEWRRLRMDELGLQDASWGTSDTYGAGSLSPDGRWWAGQSRDGVIVLDLGTGVAETVDLGSDWTAWVRWRADSRSLVVSHGDRSMRAELLELPSRRRTALPFRAWQAQFAPDGTAYSLKPAGRGRAELLTWRGETPVVQGEVRIPGMRAWAGGLLGPGVTAGRFLFPVQRAPYRVIDLVVVGTESLEAEARLHITHRDLARYASSEWLDPETVLLELGPGLIAWRPADGDFYRVTSSPTPRNGFATLDVAVDLAL